MTPASQLSTEDEAKLTLYLTRGQSMYERSSFGAQLERASLFGQALDATLVADPLNNPYPDAAIHRVRTRSPKVKVGEEGELIYGAGTITARPTSEFRPTDSQAPDSKLMDNVYTVTRYLDEIGKHSQLCRRVLEKYYGDMGARYAGGQPGRLFSLYAYTDAGREILIRDMKDAADREKAGAPRSTLDVHLRLENHAAEEWGRTVLAPVNGCAVNKKPHSKRWRRLMLQACDREARVLLLNSAKHWNRAVQVIGK